MRRHRDHNRNQSGMALIIVMTLLAALLAGGSVVLVLQLSSTKTAAFVKEQRAALYCAEAGLNAGRLQFERQTGLWNSILLTRQYDEAGLTPVEPYPDWYPYEKDIDGDGTPDFSVTIMDDADGDDSDAACNGATAGLLATDNGQGCDKNSRIIVVSSCTKYPNTPSQVMEVIQVTGPGGCVYSLQLGACETGQGG